MDFSISTTFLESKMDEFLNTLAERGYSHSTLEEYRSSLRKVWTFIGNTEYTKNTADTFLANVLPGLSVSDSYKKHIRTAVRRLNDYLSDMPYCYTLSAKRMDLTHVFHEALEGYLSSMVGRGLKPATIEVRRIFAMQFLLSMEKQGVTNTKKIKPSHIGAALLSSGSAEGFCGKIPNFLKYLYYTGKTQTDLSMVVPTFLSENKLPTVYKKEELLKVINSINISRVAGKRDYAILLMLITYGIRATDLVGFNVSDIDFQRNRFSFIQSKTGNEYRAVLLPTVRDALFSYLSDINPNTDDIPLFQRISAPYGRLSRSAVWSIVSSRLKNAVNTDGRKKGPHAMRSSMASGLIADDVPYDVVRKVLGHTDPNATKRYISIDIERLRRCALECPPVTGCFASYLEGGDWK